MIKQLLSRALLVIGATLFCAGGFADGAAGGDAFRATAADYASKAQKAASQGQDAIAALYYQQASIKTDAAALADKGQWSDIDWTQYHTNESLIGEKLSAANAGKNVAQEKTLKNKMLKNKIVENE
ncbi:MAG: hypothetical protein ACI8PP_002683 [Candidatus Pseudothioglobus sp.]|jgi:hypothetical protein